MSRCNVCTRLDDIMHNACRQDLDNRASLAYSPRLYRMCLTCTRLDRMRTRDRCFRLHSLDRNRRT